MTKPPASPAERLAHTPLPWGIGSSHTTVWASDGSIIADAFESNDRPIEEVEANAQFIVTACNNYEALKKSHDALLAKISKYRELAGCCYQFVGAHDGQLNWLNILSAAASGEEFEIETLLPYTLPEDRKHLKTDEGIPLANAKALEGK